MKVVVTARLPQQGSMAWLHSIHAWADLLYVQRIPLESTAEECTVYTYLYATAHLPLCHCSSRPRALSSQQGPCSTALQHGCAQSTCGLQLTSRALLSAADGPSETGAHLPLRLCSSAVGHERSAAAVGIKEGQGGWDPEDF